MLKLFEKNRKKEDFKGQNKIGVSGIKKAIKFKVSSENCENYEAKLISILVNVLDSLIILLTFKSDIK